MTAIPQHRSTDEVVMKEYKEQVVLAELRNAGQRELGVHLGSNRSIRE